MNEGMEHDPRKVAEFLGFVGYCLGWKAKAAHEKQDGLWILFVDNIHAPRDREVMESGQQVLSRLYDRVVVSALRRFVTGASLQMAMVTRGMDPGELADLSGVSISTLRRWSDDPEVKATSDAMRRVYNALQKRPLDAPISWDELSSGMVRP